MAAWYRFPMALEAMVSDQGEVTFRVTIQRSGVIHPDGEKHPSHAYGTEHVDRTAVYALNRAHEDFVDYWRDYNDQASDQETDQGAQESESEASGHVLERRGRLRLRQRRSESPGNDGPEQGVQDGGGHLRGASDREPGEERPEGEALLRLIREQIREYVRPYAFREERLPDGEA